MTVYLGTLGRMVEIYTTPSATVVAEERYTFSTTLEGRRKAQVRPVGRRTWTWNSGLANPSEQGTLAELAQGAWGNGPFVFVSADAPGTNLLTPAAASCDPAERAALNVTASGPMLTPDGWAGRSYMPPTGANLFFGVTASGAILPGQRVPVIPGRAVSGSVYVLGAGAYCRVLFYDSADVLVSQFNSTVLATAGTVVRSWVTALAPANAVSARIVAVSATQAARPSVTWSDTLLPWGDGQGCTKAVVHGASREIEMASTDLRGGRYSNLSFTVSEVG